jgi:hypothetical protein
LSGHRLYQKIAVSRTANRERRIESNDGTGKGGVSMSAARVRVADDDEDAAPVTILDGLGRVVRVVPAKEFRREHGVSRRPTTDKWRRRRERMKTDELEEGAVETAVQP